MLTQVDVTNSRGNVLSLLMEEDEGGYQVADIDGLGPVKATLVSTSNAGVDGEIFQSAKRPARNIKIKLDLDPDFDSKDYTELRNDLYAWFMPKARISMRWYLDTGLYLDIEGIVEDMVPKMFDSDPDVTISIMCYQPDFVDARMVSLDGFTVDDETNTEIDYPGTVEAGTVLTINFNRAATEFTIYNTDESGQRYQLDYSGTILNGDKIVISSLRGNKGLTLTRAGISSSVLYNRSPQSSWVELTEGLNQFRVYAEGDPIPYVLEYIVRYGGL
jgi:hypothetical protein